MKRIYFSINSLFLVPINLKQDELSGCLSFRRRRNLFNYTKRFLLRRNDKRVCRNKNTSAIFLLLILLCTFNIVACSSTKKTSASNNQTKETVKNDTYRVIVSLISTGQGIDRNAKEKFIVYNDSMAVINHIFTKYEEIHWGREGEVDYCMMLKELNSSKQKIFVDGLKNIFADNKLVFIKENTPCVNKRK